MINSSLKMTIEEWYNGISAEFDVIPFTQEERVHYESYYLDAGLLNPRRVEYFRRHYISTFKKASEYLLEFNQPTILDLGGGTGTQLLYLALKGARIICIDLDDIALSILDKRIVFYNNKYNCDLDIIVVRSNTFDVDYRNYGPINGLYSMFAFNMMQPSRVLLNKIIPYTSKDFRLAVIDGNSMGYVTRIISRLTRNQRYNTTADVVWSPVEFSNYLIENNFQIDSHLGAVSVPPFLWSVLPYSFVEKLDSVLNKWWFTSISHQILAKRK